MKKIPFTKHTESGENKSGHGHGNKALAPPPGTAPVPASGMSAGTDGETPAPNTSTGTPEVPGDLDGDGKADGPDGMPGVSQEPRAVPPAPSAEGVAASVPDGDPVPRTADDRPVEDKHAHLRTGGPGRTAPGQPG
jgi:hypothetical protein